MKGKRIKIAGSEFLEIEASDYFFGGAPKELEGQTLFVPIPTPDDKLEFPANPELENVYFYVSSGLASYSVEREEKTAPIGKKREAGFSAIQLNLFDELDWHFECLGVLSAHGWLGRDGDLSEQYVEKVASICGDAEIRRAKEQFGENWTCYIGELAALHLVKPLSRLWYAANMISLYYAHYDHLRLGYLWAEYQIRMRHETDSLRGKKSVASAQMGGAEHARAFENRRQRIIESIKRFVESGQSVSNAALLTFKNGLGSSAEANRKLWTRHKPK